MKLNFVVDEKTYSIEVPQDILEDGEEFFQKMDRDMNHGWQMSREFIENPNKINRCQIAADKLLNSLSTCNETMVMLMAGYILKRLPGITRVIADTHGEMLNTEMIFEEKTNEAGRHQIPPVKQNANAQQIPKAMTKMEAMEQAGKEVAKVYKVGKNYRYATLDRNTGKWIESPLMKSGKEAHEHRMKAFRRRLDELLASKD